VESLKRDIYDTNRKSVIRVSFGINCAVAVYSISYERTDGALHAFKYFTGHNPAYCKEKNVYKIKK